MPIHLRPITRRQFLKRSLAAGAAMGLAPSLMAAGKKVDSDSWALLSDTHLAANHDQLGRGINMVDHFNSVSRELLALPKLPAGVFVNGDCAFNSGETGDYATVAEMLTPIRR